MIVILKRILKLFSMTARIKWLLIKSQDDPFFITLYLIKKYLFKKYLIEVGEKIVVGENLKLPHPRSIVIGDGVKIGNNVTVAHGVTLGGNMGKQKFVSGWLRKTPIIEDNVYLGANCVIGGPIVIGQNSVVAANSVITHDVPPNSLARGYNSITQLTKTYNSEKVGFEENFET